MNIEKIWLRILAIVLVITFFTLLVFRNNVAALIDILFIFALLYFIRYLYEKNKREVSNRDISNKQSIRSYGRNNKQNFDNPFPINTLSELEEVKSPSIDVLEECEEENTCINVYELPKVSDYVEDKNIVDMIANQKYKVGLPAKFNDISEVIDLTECYSLLIYGSIASGKSSITHAILSDILLKNKPDELKLVIFDSKKLEYSDYNGLPHLLCPVVTNTKKISETLKRIVQEMENRYDEFEKTGTKNIIVYNDLVDSKNNIGNSEEKMRKMPYLYVFVDELDDLAVYDKNIVECVFRITKYGRIAGINIICTTTTVAYNSFSIEFINSFNSVISFKTSSERDARLLFGNKDSLKLNQYEFMYKQKGIVSPKTYESIIFNNMKNVIDFILEQAKTRYDARFERAG